MIKIFRRIRQQLLNSGQMKKYSLYAIGEIVLVVLGILIALQINNWNQQQVNRKTEIKYLKNIQKDLGNDTVRIKFLIINRFDRKIEGLTLAKEYARGNYVVKDTAEFLEEVVFGAVYSNGIEFLRTHTYDELISTGNLQLINNDSLKTLITNYYNLVEDQKTNVGHYINGYTTYINSLKTFEEKASNFISEGDKKFMMKYLKSDKTIQKANLEITYGKIVRTLVKSIDKYAKQLDKIIQQEIEK